MICLHTLFHMTAVTSITLYAKYNSHVPNFSYTLYKQIKEVTDSVQRSITKPSLRAHSKWYQHPSHLVIFVQPSHWYLIWEIKVYSKKAMSHYRSLLFANECTSDCLKNNIKIYVKIAPTHFGAVTPSSGSSLSMLAKVTLC